MDAALITGMFNVGFNVGNTFSKDVVNSADSDFSNIFSKELNNKKGVLNEKENIKEVRKEDVNKKDEVAKKDEMENSKVDDVKKEDKIEDKGKDEKKTKDKKDEEKINGLAERIITEVKNIDVENLDELKNVVESLADVENIGITNDELLKLQEELKLRLSQDVFEVGPQNVETEKITFNKYDELENKLEALRKKFDDSNDKDVDLEDELKLDEGELGVNENSLNSEFESYFNEEKGLNSNTESKNEKKFNVTDFRKKDINNLEQVDFNIEDVKSEIEDIRLDTTSEVLQNSTVDMQEQIDIIRQVSEKIDINLYEDKSEMIVKLKPDHLGKVTVEIAVENGNITAKFLAESEKVKEILESNMQDLKDHLAKQGMMVQEFSVSVGDRDRENIFEQKNYKTFKKNQKVLEVDNGIHAVGDNYGIDTNNISYYWPDSTVSFSA